MLSIRLPYIRDNEEFFSLLQSLGVGTICTSGRCPNRPVCFASRRLSVLILGQTCTRTCRFCSVRKAKRGEDFSHEIPNLISLVETCKLRFLVITSVTRDDLPDGGASHFCNVVNSLKTRFPSLKIELLIPDFNGNLTSVDQVASLGVEVVGHNVETVPRLYEVIRPQADYQRSLAVLARLVKRGKSLVKSSVMVGLGESEGELRSVFKDLREVGVSALCIGQYLSPSKTSFPVKRYYDSEDFARLKEIALEAGFRYVWAGPRVRSSFVGEELYGQ